MSWSKERPTEPGAYLNRSAEPGYTLISAVCIVRGDDGVLRYDDPDCGDLVVEENEPPLSEWCRLVPLPDRKKLAEFLIDLSDRYLDRK